MDRNIRRQDRQSGRDAPFDETFQHLAIEESSDTSGTTSLSRPPEDYQTASGTFNGFNQSRQPSFYSTQPSPGFNAPPGGTWPRQSLAPQSVSQSFGMGFFNPPPQQPLQSPFAPFDGRQVSQFSPYSFVPSQSYGQPMAPAGLSAASRTTPFMPQAPHGRRAAAPTPLSIAPGPASFAPQQSYGQQAGRLASPFGSLRSPSALRAEAPEFLGSHQGPKLFKVYFLPREEQIPQHSVIHGQKNQEGFYVHPVLVVDYDQSRNLAFFYSLTSRLPDAINDLRICFKLGSDPDDTGEEVLRLGRGSEIMTQKTFVNLEQRFSIEWPHLRPWSRNVFIDPSEKPKFDEKIARLEAAQNRFIYKPLPRDLTWVVPGTILMLKNDPRSSTFGAPVLFLSQRNNYIQFLRIKEIGNLDYIGRNQVGTKNHLRMKIGRVGERNPGGAPILYIDDTCQEMRVPSYVEGSVDSRWRPMSEFVTWTYPFMVIQAGSMNKMREYLARHHNERQSSRGNRGRGNSGSGGGRGRGRGQGPRTVMNQEM